MLYCAFIRSRAFHCREQNRSAQFRFAQRLFAGEDGAFNIDGEYSVRLNKSNGVLAILFIGLHAIRQTNGDKLQRIVTGLFRNSAIAIWLVSRPASNPARR